MRLIPSLAVPVILTGYGDQLNASAPSTTTNNTVDFRNLMCHGI